MRLSSAKLTQQRGFSLVEIAIVLVIIGLLLGGVLKGQQMVENAKIKSFIDDIRAVGSAANDYQATYRKKPNMEVLIKNNMVVYKTADLVSTGQNSYVDLASGQRLRVASTTLAKRGIGVCLQFVDGDLAKEIDLRIDDGDGKTGIVQANKGNTQPTTKIGTATYADASNHSLCYRP